MSPSSFWDRDGNHTLLDPYPDSFAHWQRGQPLDGARQALLTRLETLLGATIVRTEDRSLSVTNLTLEIELEGGEQAIIRMPVFQSSDDTTSVYVSRSPEKFDSEIGLMGWLAQRTTLPVPRIRRLVCVPEESQPLAVIEKLPGDCLLNVYGGLPLASKELITREIANAMLEIASLEVPQGIGTVTFRNGVAETIPLIVAEPAITPERVFATLEEYLYSLVDVLRHSDRIGSDSASKATANGVLDRLTHELSGILGKLSGATYRRCVLSHDDLRETNVLVDEQGHLTGIVDWEFHSTKPIVLAARYPVWIQYSGIHDPRFANEYACWVSSPDDAARLKALYSQVIKERDEEYWHALVDGEVLRHIEEWLTETCPDPGCQRLSWWMDTMFIQGSHA
ncbi:hypothetical protein C8Q74DRAFT_131080 [Fomes fomentarius]|nr:hypothetical protein C8Q74DRAFT_131080 [Fomes fomentarius]